MEFMATYLSPDRKVTPSRHLSIAQHTSLYGGTAHKVSNSTNKGFLRKYIFRCRFAKVREQNKQNEGFNTRSSQVLRMRRGSLALLVLLPSLWAVPT
jgi:hypothetical protein